MKTKVVLLLCLSICIGIKQLSAQGGNIFDTFIVTLRQGITMDQYLDFLRTRYVSEYNKNFPGSKLKIGCTDSWIKKNQYSFFYTFDSDMDYSRYYKNNGKDMSDVCKAAWEKMDSIKKEAGKYILDSKRVNADWEMWMDEIVIK